MSIVDDLFENNVKSALQGAVSIAWDTCHKIYLLMDENQHQEMITYGYDPLIRLDSIGHEEAFKELRQWYDESCALKFISSVRTVDGDPNEGFLDLIPQFVDEEEDS